jgi:thiol-disulfide isomerase/thioredoxin
MRRELLQPVHTVAGMLTSVMSGISAKVTAGIHPNMELIDACKVFPNMKCGLVSLIDNTKNLENPKEPTPELVKRQNHEKLLKFVNDPTKPKACVIVFAHWCPHCHTLIEELAKRMDSLKGNGVEYLLINGESVHSDAFQGSKAIIQLQHYPTILSKVGNAGKEVRSIDEATHMTLGTNSQNVAKDAVPSLDVEDEVVEDPLSMLF